MFTRCAALAALACWPASLGAQIGLASATAGIALSATKVASVSVSLPAGSSATLPGALITGPNDFTPLSVATTWDVDPARTAAVTLVGYFGPAVTAGPAMAGSAGGTRVLFTQTISDANALGARSDDLQMRIDLSGAPDLPAGSYTGTLNLQVITQ